MRCSPSIGCGRHGRLAACEVQLRAVPHQVAPGGQLAQGHMTGAQTAYPCLGRGEAGPAPCSPSCTRTAQPFPDSTWTAGLSAPTVCCCATAPVGRTELRRPRTASASPNSTQRYRTEMITHKVADDRRASPYTMYCRCSWPKQGAEESPTGSTYRSPGLYTRRARHFSEPRRLGRVPR